MAGIYPSFPAALSTILRNEGIRGFYSGKFLKLSNVKFDLSLLYTIGWWPALAQKIPSYGLTWMFFQQMKRQYEEWFHESPSGETSFYIGATAAAAAVCVMIPMDTVKTRLVLQGAGGNGGTVYTGVRDCFVKVFQEEGLGAFYLSLIPRLASVVPMISIQFGAYELIKGHFIQEKREKVRVYMENERLKRLQNRFGFIEMIYGKKWKRSFGLIKKITVRRRRNRMDTSYDQNAVNNGNNSHNQRSRQSQ